MRKFCWLIIDEKVGNANQAIALAKALGINYELKKLEYNFFAKLPNWLKFDSLIGIKNAAVLQEPYPDIIISSGRKTAAASSYLKKISPEIFTIHLMHPDLAFKNFDLVCLPLHDKQEQHQVFNNITYSVGAPCFLDKKQIEKKSKEFLLEYSNLKPPFISLIIGGKTKDGDYSEEEILWLADKASELALKNKAYLLITTCRRTNPNISSKITSKLTAPFFFFDWHNMDLKNNPYQAFLYLSDYFITTGDSVSVACESLSTGKPLYVYRKDNLLYHKHKKFLDYLHNFGYIKYLNEKTENLEKWDYQPLQEAEKLGKIIEEKMKNVSVSITSKNA